MPTEAYWTRANVAVSLSWCDGDHGYGSYSLRVLGVGGDQNVIVIPNQSLVNTLLFAGQEAPDCPACVEYKGRLAKALAELQSLDAEIVVLNEQVRGLLRDRTALSEELNKKVRLNT